jgi:hypothetical protein
MTTSINKVEQPPNEVSSGKVAGRLLRRRTILFGVAVILAGSICYRIATSPILEIPVGTSIRFDDFTFAIEKSQVRNLDKNEPKKRYLIVTMKVINEAKRVPYKFRRSIVVMSDDKGIESGVSAKGQAILDQEKTSPDALAAPLAPGSSGTTELAFVLPENVKKPRFKISHGGPILDVVDDFFAGKRRLLP